MLGTGKDSLGFELAYNALRNDQGRVVCGTGVPRPRGFSQFEGPLVERLYLARDPLVCEVAIDPSKYPTSPAFNNRLKEVRLPASEPRCKYFKQC